MSRSRLPPADVEPRRTRLRSAAADLLWGSRCVGCDVGGAGLCPVCLRELEADVGLRSVLCGTDGWLDVYSGAPYSGAVAQAVPAFKERGRADLLRPLSAALARAVADACTQAVVDTEADTAADVGTSRSLWLVPVPQSRSARRSRGTAPVLRLTRAAATVLRRTTALDVRIATAVLHHVREVADQAELSRADRQTNLNGAIGPCRGPMLEHLRAVRANGGRVLLIDDVVTSGSTLGECHRALASGGVTVTAAAVVADTPLAERQ